MKRTKNVIEPTPSGVTSKSLRSINGTSSTSTERGSRTTMMRRRGGREGERGGTGDEGAEGGRLTLAHVARHDVVKLRHQLCATTSMSDAGRRHSNGLVTDDDAGTRQALSAATM